VVAALCFSAGLALLVAGHSAGLSWVLIVLGLAVAARAHALDEGDRR
jgi:hypothetical protein